MDLEQLLDQKLIDQQGLLLLNYKAIGMDEQTLVCLMLIYKLNQQGIQFVTPAHLEQFMPLSSKQIDELLVLMIQKEYLLMDYTHATLRPNEDVIFALILNRYKCEAIQQEKLSNSGVTSLFAHIEKEFGRSLSPIEISTLQEWYHIYGEKMIYNALKEAILSGVKNFRYIDRILVNWQKQGYQATKFVEVDVEGEQLQNVDWLAIDE